MDIALYQVALKILLRNGDYFLFLTDTITGKLDLPGGRINENELETPFETIIRREVNEEVGRDLEYRLGRPIYEYRARFKNGGPHVFIVIFEADYLRGSVRLSAEHSAYRWINKDMEFAAEDFFNEEAYREFDRYIKSIQ